MDITKHQQILKDWENNIKKYSNVSDSNARFIKLYYAIRNIKELTEIKENIVNYEESFYQQTRRVDNKLFELRDLCTKGILLMQQLITHKLSVYSNGEFSEFISKNIKRRLQEDKDRNLDLVFILPDFLLSNDCKVYMKDFKYDKRITYIKESEYEDFMFHRDKDNTLIRIFTDSTNIEKLDKIYNVKVDI